MLDLKTILEQDAIFKIIQIICSKELIKTFLTYIKYFFHKNFE
jgi:hypothetical protein